MKQDLLDKAVSVSNKIVVLSSLLDAAKDTTRSSITLSSKRLDLIRPQLTEFLESELIKLKNDFDKL
jgi:hypothetical protein